MRWWPSTALSVVDSIQVARFTGSRTRTYTAIDECVRYGELPPYNIALATTLQMNNEDKEQFGVGPQRSGALNCVQDTEERSRDDS